MNQELVPCRNLEYEGEFHGCELKSMHGVKYWFRKNADAQGLPSRVQFCKLRGRVNSVLDCYEKGFMHCYDPEKATQE